MKLTFTKMEGAGNDFVVIDNRHGKIRLAAKQIRKIADRRFGVGCDQLLVLEKSSSADFRMVIFNADGGAVEMCGNGIRCLAKFIRDNRLSTKTKLAIETAAGAIFPEIVSRPKSHGTLQVRVDMGRPADKGKRRVDGTDGHCISMGNPHFVTFVGDVATAPVATAGPILENHNYFPARTNVEFVEVSNRKLIKMRVWERSAGETFACGTGACAALVASVISGRTDRRVEAHLKGGKLVIEWNEKTGHVFMTGPATTVFEGEIEC